MPAFGYLNPEDPDSQDAAVLRFKACLPHIPKDAEVAIITTAGFTSNSPTKSTADFPHSLAELMREWINKTYPDNTWKIIAKPLCWTTGEEIRNGMISATEEGFGTEEDVLVLVGATNNNFYIRRMRLYLEKYRLDSGVWEIKIIPSEHHPKYLSKDGWRHEFPAWVKALVVTRAPQLYRILMYTKCLLRRRKR